MATTEERLMIAIEARQTKLEKEMAKASRNFEAGASKMERRAKTLTTRLNATLAKAGAGVGGQFKNFGAGLLGGIAAGFTVDKMKALLDASTAITNALKVAGLSGEDLNKVYQQLYQSAQRNAAPIDALVTLYSRLSGAQKELGVSTGEILTLTDNVAKSIRLSGGSVAEASGALLQLSQALGGGKIQAEEYNSLIDGARPLLQAAAAGMKQAGGSVAELTRLVKNGEVSSRAFFDAINAGAPILDQKLAGATMTVSQGLVQVQNSLIDAARKFDETTETSKRLGASLNETAIAIQNFDVDHAVAELDKFVKKADDAIGALNNFSYALGKKIGLDKVGEAISHIPGMESMGMFSWNRVSRRMEGDVPEADRAITDWAQRKYGNKSAPGKTGRLPAAPKPTQIDITDPKYAVPATSKGGSSGRGGKTAADSFDRLNDAVNRFVDSVVKAESGGNANAKNPNSSATGVGQFIESTWLRLFKQNFPDRAQSMSDQTILALRKDSEISRSLIEAYAKENAAILRQAGVGVNEMALHLAHFLGPQGAVKVLQAAPTTPVSQLLDQKAINANPTILGYGATAGDVVRYAQNRAAALDGEKASVDGLKDSWEGLRGSSLDASQQMADDVQRIADAERDFVGSIAHDLINGVEPIDALRNAVSRLADTLIDNLLDSIFRVKAAGAGGGGGFLSMLFGGGAGVSSFVPGILSGSLVGLFADGGHVTGPGSSTSDSIPAMLSDGEFIVNASATRKNRALLEAINSGKAPGFASGGAVGGSNVARLQTPANSNAPNVTIAPTINLHSSGGDPAQNADLAKQVSKQVEGSIRGLISSEIQKQTRPGNLLNTRTR